MSSRLAVIVDADAHELRATESALSAVGFVVAPVGSFAEARALLQAISPELVVADVKLQAYNGLHLASVFARVRPRTPFLITHSVYDPVLENDARKLGAVYVVKTHDRAELTERALSLVNRDESSATTIRRWPRKIVPHSLQAIAATTDVEVVDVSYGGVKLMFRRAEPQNPGTPQSFSVVFPSLELSMRASRVWTAPDVDGAGWLCGVDVTDNDGSSSDRWKTFVDSVQ